MSTLTARSVDGEDVTRWDHDLEHLLWTLPTPRRRPRPHCSATARSSGARCKARAMHNSSLCSVHSGRASQTSRLPAGPLIVAVTARGVVLNQRPFSAAQAFWRAKKSGHLTLAAADRLAHELLGEHPASLWGDDWWTVGAR